MKLRVSTLVLALVLPVTPLAVALAQAPPSSSTVRLSVSPAGSGGTFDFGIRSPYGTQAYTVFALSPGRNAFPVADGTTDSSGGASLSLVLLAEPGLVLVLLQHQDRSGRSIAGAHEVRRPAVRAREGAAGQRAHVAAEAPGAAREGADHRERCAVSYTHLTLPTKA